MNPLLWLGVVSTLLLIVAVVFDADFLDSLEIGGDLLTLPVVAAFVGAFGFGAGAVSDQIGVLAVLPGIGAGVVFGWLAHRLTQAAIHMPTGVTDRNDSLVGSIGRIVTPNAPDRTGEVLLSRPTGPLKVAFRADTTLELGTQVVVVEVDSATLVSVTPLGLEWPEA